jgi:hypothetical protein
MAFQPKRGSFEIESKVFEGFHHALLGAAIWRCASDAPDVPGLRRRANRNQASCREAVPRRRQIADPLTPQSP